jgi:2,5-diamino-6-(ribosylamino)-4(3H)-pyrimidinone 5'-phosphate reductase
MLSGSNTILAADFPEEDPDEYQEAAAELEGQLIESRQLLSIVDSRGRIQNWHVIRKQPWWRDAITLCSEATPKSYLDYLQDSHVDYIISGGKHVNLRAALGELNRRFGVEVVRVDSGGILNGVLLREGLVNEVSVLISPELIGEPHRGRCSLLLI